MSASAPDEQAPGVVELLAELVCECGRAAAYDLRELLEIDFRSTWADRPLIEARLAVLLRQELGVPESTAPTEGDRP